MLMAKHVNESRRKKVFMKIVFDRIIPSKYGGRNVNKPIIEIFFNEKMRLFTRSCVRARRSFIMGFGRNRKAPNTFILFYAKVAPFSSAEPLNTWNWQH